MLIFPQVDNLSSEFDKHSLKKYISTPTLVAKFHIYLFKTGAKHNNQSSELHVNMSDLSVQGNFHMPSPSG